MGTVLSNFHGRSARTRAREDAQLAPTNSSKSGRSDPIDSRSRIRNAKGEDIGQPFAHSRVVPLEPERRVVSRCIVTCDFFYFFPACRTSRFATIPRRRAHVLQECRARAKIENRSAALNCFVFFDVFRISRFSSIPELSIGDSHRFLSILCALPKDISRTTISWIRTSSSCVRRFFLSSTFVCYVVAFALVDGEQGSDAKKRLANALERGFC